MKAVAQFSNPGNISATITITATLDRWKELSDDLKDVPFIGVAGELRSAITQLQIQLMGQINYVPVADPTVMSDAQLGRAYSDAMGE